MKTNAKNCYCHTCQKAFHYLGINRHRAMHRDRYEDCEITYTHGDTYIHKFSTRRVKGYQPKGDGTKLQNPPRSKK